MNSTGNVGVSLFRWHQCAIGKKVAPVIPKVDTESISSAQFETRHNQSTPTFLTSTFILPQGLHTAAWSRPLQTSSPLIHHWIGGWGSSSAMALRSQGEEWWTSALLRTTGWISWRGCQGGPAHSRRLPLHFDRQKWCCTSCRCLPAVKKGERTIDVWDLASLI